MDEIITTQGLLFENEHPSTMASKLLDCKLIYKNRVNFPNSRAKFLFSNEEISSLKLYLKISNLEFQTCLLNSLIESKFFLFIYLFIYLFILGASGQN